MFLLIELELTFRFLWRYLNKLINSENHVSYFRHNRTMIFITEIVCAEDKFKPRRRHRDSAVTIAVGSTLAVLSVVTVIGYVSFGPHHRDSSVIAWWNRLDLSRRCSATSRWKLSVTAQWSSKRLAWQQERGIHPPRNDSRRRLPFSILVQFGK